MPDDYEGGEHKFTRDQQRQLDKFKTENLMHRDGDKAAREAIKGWKPYNMNQSTSVGKGDSRRPNTLSPKEYGLRYDLAVGNITKEQFDTEMRKLK
jgi:hypothetical protein